MHLTPHTPQFAFVSVSTASPLQHRAVSTPASQLNPSGQACVFEHVPALSQYPH
jgi:hypothetical protein